MPRLSLAKLERHLYSAADRLRQEGLDAATYKDYIFGMLFLKRCSDVFDAERERIVGRKMSQGMAVHEAAAAYGENPDFYDGFFVPERARWTYLQDKLNDATEFHAGRAQNYLRPEHVEKIVSTFDRYENVPAYARVVPIEEIADAANDFNLNIRRYVDNSPPPEPHDVRAHLLGGVPVARSGGQAPALRSAGV